MTKLKKFTSIWSTVLLGLIIFAFQSLGQVHLSSEMGQQASPPAQQDFSKNTWELPADAEKTKNPVAATEESIAKGKELYFGKAGNCVFCHGDTGAGNEANMPRLRRKPADISSKERMAEMTDGEVFWKISKGITGIMPAGEKRMSEEERWNLVNFVRTLAKDKPKA
jgi:mono/diheme cytochrome c family protein